MSGGTTGFDAVGGETDVPFHVRVNFNRNNREGIQHIDFEYNGDIFDAGVVSEIRDGVLGILEQAADNPDIRLNALVLSPSRLIAAECWVEENLAQADEPTALQCGGLRNALENGTGTLKVALAADRATLTAGLTALLTRFGMSREILIGVRSGREVLPFGMKVDTAMPARAFRSLVDEKLKKLNAIKDYPLSCRTDLDFKPDIILSFCAPEADSDAEIALYVSEDGVEIRYDETRCPDRYITAFASALETLCAAMGGDTALRTIPLVKTHAEKHIITLKNEGTINAILERMAREQPEKRVLTAVDGAMTLSELDRTANRIGHALIKRGIRPHDRVLLLMRRTHALVACVFGVLKAGAAFIPMDPNYPRERINQILEDSDAALIITDVPEVAEGFSRCVAPSALVSDDDTAPDVEVTPDDLCFIIYTSGTTGRPKGVALSHRGISNYIAPEPENAPIYALATRCHGMLCLSSVSFIVFLREIFGTILNGVHVVLCDEEQMVNPMAIAALVKKHGIDALGATPTRLLQYSEIPAFCEALRGVRVMIVGGEGFPGRLFRVIREYSDCEIYNSYGPTGGHDRLPPEAHGLRAGVRGLPDAQRVGPHLRRRRRRAAALCRGRAVCRRRGRGHRLLP